MHKLGSSPIGCEDFSIPGIGSSPIGYEGFVQPRKGQGEAETKLVKRGITMLTKQLLSGMILQVVPLHLGFIVDRRCGTKRCVHTISYMHVDN